MNLGIIGYGNIGELIVKNLINIDFLKENEIYLSNRTFSKLNEVKELNSNIILCANNVELSKKSDILFISVRTPDLIEVLKEVTPFINEDCHIIHSSAGIGFNEISDIYDGPVSCVIPSISSSVCGKNKKNGVSIFFHNPKVSKEDINNIENIFSQFSEVKRVDNYKDLEVLTILTSCMPALIVCSTSLFKDKIAEKSSICKEELSSLLNETIISTLNILDSNVMDEKELINMVATKNGITEQGLNYLKDKLPEFYEDLIKVLL